MTPRYFAMADLLREPVVTRFDVLYGIEVLRNMGRLRRQTMDEALGVGRSRVLEAMAAFYSGREWRWAGQSYVRISS